MWNADSTDWANTPGEKANLFKGVLRAADHNCAVLSPSIFTSQPGAFAFEPQDESGEYGDIQCALCGDLLRTTREQKRGICDRCAASAAKKKILFQ